MAAASVTNSFINGTSADATEVNQNFTDLVNFANNSTVHTDGTKSMTGNLDLSANKIIAVAAGTATTDAINKGQLDTVSTAASDAQADATQALADAAAAQADADTGIADAAAAQADATQAIADAAAAQADADTALASTLGVVTYDSSTTDESLTTSNQTIFTVSWTGVSGRLYKLTWLDTLDFSIFTNRTIIQEIVSGAGPSGTIQARNNTDETNSSLSRGELSAVVSGTGTMTYSAVARANNTGTGLERSASEKAWFIVEDIGEA